MFFMKNTQNDVFLSTQHDFIFSFFDRDKVSRTKVLTEYEMNADEDSFDTSSISHWNDIEWTFACKYQEHSVTSLHLKTRNLSDIEWLQKENQKMCLIRKIRSLFRQVAIERTRGTILEQVEKSSTWKWRSSANPTYSL